MALSPKISMPSWVILLCLAVSFAGIIDRDLWTPDEPRDAAISLEMSRTGNIVIPHLAGKPFVEKPPLYFAVAAGFAKTLGNILGNTGAIRLSTAFWGIGTLLMTFLLAKRISNHSQALLAPAILATMVGFVLNMHWVRVDAALVFFVSASAWSFAEAYFGGRRWFCITGGLFTAGAFLSKGVIGPLLIAFAWFGMVIPWIINQRGRKFDLFITQHLLALLAFIIPVGAWMLMLRLNGGPQLWHEWFYENHFGRLTGTATVLGHMRAGHPFYYVETFLFYALPWTPVIILWLFKVIQDFIKTRLAQPKDIFLVVWSVGSVLLLSASVTKRDIYLAPVLPVFALICAEMLTGDVHRWIKHFFNFWIGLALFLLVGSSTSSLWAGFLPASTPEQVSAFLCTFGLRNIVAGFGFIIGIAVIFRSWNMTAPARLTAITALLYIGFFAVAGKAIDGEKMLGKGTRAFAERIPQERKSKVAGWNFEETSRAMFYYYCNWTVPLIDDKNRLFRIVAGKDSEFDSVIVTREPSIPDLFGKKKYRIITEEYVGAAKHKRDLHWIEGVKHKDDGSSTKEREPNSEK
jgi:4-amino-4-deoxy-L-arabinose transferase-like glycosyltransferase